MHSFLQLLQFTIGRFRPLEIFPPFVLTSFRSPGHFLDVHHITAQVGYTIADITLQRIHHGKYRNDGKYTYGNPQQTQYSSEFIDRKCMNCKLQAFPENAKNPKNSFSFSLGINRAIRDRLAD